MQTILIAHLWHRLLPFVLVLPLLAGCGFHLRGQAQLPFEQAWVDGGGSSGSLADSLRQTLKSQGKLSESRDGAQLRLRIVDEKRSKDILSLTGAGKVREYRLTYRLTLLVENALGEAAMSPITLELTREFTHDDTQMLATEAKESQLAQNMLQDALRQALRRLSYYKRKP